ncbi:MAG: isoprenylcysteine carboxylmethyltransferase family protein [Candidatus Marinimicrobia bacterium]|jgi:protein-S-isoprenylcysteine O-methyltransferase Ste14|nr:isoprenylcysteine carboxylmethyltransferase family protein [Candidatus Neomarinimicrobiota bacterium]MBT3838388.1 isoprenylcysteine carboxylmethyltransferase family protein [Candidatus Neomarinimicrobiota bacterium]MBT3998693.1 isoprenylcysteine carboxylmethyltransferase family protein [Candidatus Neomarinimicrobiota bacterium]MBT4283272.1 isoprenylcysteine carboxylmethyltransferase family protein [Candidatus Neomarinimicrobiota bacterium]MBT4578415.1 isoprenylcysteine carboxylmethyltransfer
MDLRKFLFKNRSFTPVPIVLALLYYSNPVSPFIFYGLGLMIIGELIRINAVRYAGGATRTIKVGAPSLCTTGPYAHTRNPLYLGNMTIYCGVALLAGGQYMWELFMVIFVFFTFQYSMIISLEEETLVTLFGKGYQKYRSNVPRLFPRITPWIGEDQRSPIPVLKTLKTEKRSLQNLALFLILIIVRFLLGTPS